MALSVGDIVRTSCNFLLGSGDQYQNVYHHIFDGIGGVSDAAVVTKINDWANAMYSELNNYVASNVVEQLSSVDRVDFVTDAWTVVENIGTFTPDFTPASTTQVSANQISPFVIFKTARPQSVGRKFMFPTPETNQIGGIIDASFLAAMVAFASDAVNDITIDVANVLHPGIARVGVNDWLNFTVAIVTNLVGTQRRRRPGYGA